MVPFTLVKTLLIMKYFVFKLAISDKDGYNNHFVT